MKIPTSENKAPTFGDLLGSEFRLQAAFGEKKRKIMDEMREFSTIVRNIQAIMRVSS